MGCSERNRLVTTVTRSLTKRTYNLHMCSALFTFAQRGFVAVFLLFSVACNASSKGEIHGVRVSPDGKQIALTFVKDKAITIYRIAIDTGQASRLTTNKTGEESGATFSLDGKLIAYSYAPAGEHQRIVVMNADGSNPHSLPESGTANLYAAFAPTGTTIYFARSYPPPHYHEWDVFSVRLDGSELRQLTHQNFYHISQPSLSRDGKNMVFLTEGIDTPQQITVFSAVNPGNPILSLRPHVPKEPHGDPIFDNPQYLPDGKSIAFMAASDGKDGFDYDIYRLELATGTLERLTSGNGFASDLCIFPDGKTAIFQKWRKDWRDTPVTGQLYFLNLATREVTPFNITGLY
jgi:Tol biopolymer transport system component